MNNDENTQTRDFTHKIVIINRYFHVIHTSSLK